MFVALHSLQDAASNWSHPHELQALEKPLSLRVVAATALRPSPISHELDDDIHRVAFKTEVAVSADSLGVSPSSSATTEVSSGATLAVVSLPIMPPVRRPVEANINRMTFDIPTLAPLGFVRFCLRYPHDCAAPTESVQAQVVSLTEVRKAELAIINRNVNRSIKPSDKVIASADDVWLVSPHEGKCTDYAITKRHELLARGWPGYSLLLAEVVIPSGEHHLVLVVRTREDDVVLDNLNEDVHPISAIHYKWVRAQQPNNPRFWAYINVSRPIEMAMNAH